MDRLAAVFDAMVRHSAFRTRRMKIRQHLLGQPSERRKDLVTGSLTGEERGNLDFQRIVKLIRGYRSHGITLIELIGERDSVRIQSEF